MFSGGLAAVIYTDALQTAIMVIGAFVLMILSFVRIPYEELKVRYFQAIPNTTLNDPNATCGYPRADAFHIFRDARTSDLPWPGMVFGITISATWYWCTDQVCNNIHDRCKVKVNLQPVNTDLGAHLPLETNWARFIFSCVGLATPPP